MNPSPKTLSVCIVLYKRWELSKKTINSIVATVPSDWRILWSIIDNGSQDETSKELNSFLNSVRGEVEYSQVLDDALPQTRAVNRTINAATGRYMLRVDNDIDFQQGWFEDAMSVLSDPKFKDVAFVCPTHHLKDNNKNHKSAALTLGSKEGVKLDMVSKLNMNVPGNIFGLTSVIKDIGGFYTPYNLLHADVHYCMVAKHMGYSYGYLWNTHCPHLGLPNGQTEYSKKAVHERRSEEARYSDIARGNVKEKHPQEVEFSQNLTKMIKSSGKSLPYHKNINVLIPSCGRRVELIRSFKSVFDIPRWSGKVFTCGVDQYMPASFESDEHIITPAIDSEDYITSIINICQAKEIKYIFPVIDYDVKVLSKYKSKILRQSGAEVISPDYDNAMRCFDKWETAKFFKEINIPHPATYMDASDVEGDFIEKPRYGFASKHVKTLTMTKDDSWSGEDKYVLQRKVTGQEFTVDLVSDRRFDIVSLVSRERLKTRGGEIAIGKISNHLHLFSYFDMLSKKLEITGPWNAQFILDRDQTPWFIEVNTRFGGGNPMSLRAGQNQPLISLKALERDFFGYHYRYLVDWGLVAMRYDDCKYGYIDESMGEQDDDGSKRLNG